MSDETLYKVIFYNRGQIYEVYARGLAQSPLHGFIEVEELTFNERSQVLVDPSEEKLKTDLYPAARRRAHRRGGKAGYRQDHQSRGQRDALPHRRLRPGRGWP